MESRDEINRVLLFPLDLTNRSNSSRDRLAQQVEELTQELAQVNDRLGAEISRRKLIEADRAADGAAQPQREAARLGSTELEIIAAEDTELCHQLRRQIEEISLVDDVSRAITSALDIDELFEKLAVHTKRLVDFDSLKVTLVDHDSQRFTVRYLPGTGLERRWAGELPPAADRWMQPMVVTPESAVQCDLAAAQYPQDQAYLQEGLRSSVLVPMISRDRVLGSLRLLSRRVGTYGAREQAILERLAHQIAPAVENASLYQQLRDQMAQQAVMDEVSRIITSTLNIDEVYERFAWEAKKLVPFDRMNLNLIDEAAGNYTIKHIFGPTQAGRSPGDVLSLEGTQTQRVLATRCPSVETDITARIKYPSDKDLSDVGLRSRIIVPLICRGKIIGSLSLHSSRVGAYGAAEEEILKALARQIAPAVENAAIHERSRISAALVSNTLAQLSAVLMAVDAGIILVNDERQVLWMNQKFAGLFGIEDLEPEARGAGWLSLDRLREACRGSLAQPDVVFSEQDRICADRGMSGHVGEHQTIGSVNRILREFTTPVHDANGNYIGRLWVYNDVTEDKLKEEARRETAERLRSVVEISPVGVLAVDAGGRVFLANREAQRLFGITQNMPDRLEWYERHLRLINRDNEVYGAADMPVTRSLNQGESVRGEEVHIALPGSRAVTILVSATPVRSSDGEINGAIAVLQDMTPFEQSEKLRSEFLSNVTRELKTPLATIKGSAATILAGEKSLNSREVAHYCNIIEEQTSLLKGLVDDLLDLSQIEAGSFSVNPGPATLAEVAESAKSVFAGAGFANTVELKLPGSLPKVNIDRHKIVPVLTSLLVHAAGSLEVKRALSIEAESDGVCVTVRVGDFGPGISLDMFSNPFKKFCRVGAVDSRPLPDANPGLAICKGIIEAHGGRIWVNKGESSHGGTVASISLTLPVHRQSTGISVTDTTRRAAHLGKVHRLGERTRILIVDDDLKTLQFLKRILKETGYQVLTSQDPVQAKQLIDSEEADLAILSMILTKSSGLDLLRQIREFSGIPIICITEERQPDDVVRALDCGADDYLTKPCSTLELLARVKATLRRCLLRDTIEARPPFSFGELTVNFSERRVAVADQVSNLTATEYKILYELVTHAGTVLTYNDILSRVWGPEYMGEHGLVRSFVRNLRRKLGDDAKHPTYIFNKSQVGYWLPTPTQ